MLKRFLFYFMLGCSAIFAASCASKPEPKEETPDKSTPVVKETPPVLKEAAPAKPDPREVTFLVDGMSERLKLV